MAAGLELPSDRGHLWIADPEAIGPETLEAYDRLLSPSEVVRRSSLRFVSDRRRFTVTRALVRTALSRYLPVAPEDWEFGQGVRGRPFVAGPIDVRVPDFNVSHTAGRVVCLLSRRTAGVDIEWTSRPVSVERLSERFFSEVEVADLECRPAGARRRRFFEYWTLKESYLKAVGEGLVVSPREVTFRLGDGGPVVVACPQRADRGRSWQFWQAAGGPEYRVSACLETSGVERLRIDVAFGLPGVGERWMERVASGSDLGPVGTRG